MDKWFEIWFITNSQPAAQCSMLVKLIVWAELRFFSNRQFRPKIVSGLWSLKFFGMSPSNDISPLVKNEECPPFFISFSSTCSAVPSILRVLPAKDTPETCLVDPSPKQSHCPSPWLNLPTAQQTILHVAATINGSSLQDKNLIPPTSAKLSIVYTPSFLYCTYVVLRFFRFLVVPSN